MINLWRSTADDSFTTRILWTQILALISVMSISCNAKPSITSAGKGSVSQTYFCCQRCHEYDMNHLHGISNSVTYISTYNFDTSFWPLCKHLPFHLIQIFQNPFLQLMILCLRQLRVNAAHDGEYVHCNQAAHYNDVIMSAIASQITSLAIDYSTVYSGP